MSEYDSDSAGSTVGGSAAIRPSSAGLSSSLLPMASAAAATVIPRWSAMAAATRDKQTDSDIFALGEAASRLDDLDDVLAGFGTDFSELFNADGGSITTTTCRLGPSSPSGRRRVEAVKMVPVGDVNETCNTIQISTISKKYPDGRTVHTRVIDGPIHCKERVVRVMRDAAEGPELLAEVNVPADCTDVGTYLESTLGRQRSVQQLGRKDSIGDDYDNVVECRRYGNDGGDGNQSPKSNGVGMATTSGGLGEKRHLLPNGGKSITQKNDTSIADKGQYSTSLLSTSASPHSTSNSVPPKKVSFCGEQDGDGDPLSAQQQHRQHRFQSVTEDDIRRYLPLSLLASIGETDLADHGYASTRHGSGNGDAFYDESDDADGTAARSSSSSASSLCWSCARVIRNKSRRAMPKKLIPFGRGKSRMTSSELSDDDERSLLPKPHSIVANYARMLCDNRPLFVETLFRAVKLNKLDVLKILCKIVQKSGLKLGHRDLREPESSATILHVALLYNHVDIVEYLIGHGDRELLLACYETTEYRNQTCLHVAVANGNDAVVERLILALDSQDRVLLINTLADGYYFRSLHPHGQLCLTAAAWAGSGQVIKTLVKHGGTLKLKNLEGNTLLHSIIVQSAKFPGRYDYEQLFNSVLEATGIWAEQMSYDTKFAQQRELEKTQMQISLFRELLSIRNNDGQTPLALATMHSSRLFQHIINLEKIYKIPQNKLGSIAWMTYDVTDITSFARGSYNKFSVLHILAHNSQHLSRHASLDAADAGDEDVMEMEPIRTMLTRKWDVYRWIYIVWFIVHLAYMIIFTATTVETNSSLGLERCNFSTTSRSRPEAQSPRLGLAMFIVLPIVYIVLELLDLFGTHPYRFHFMAHQNVAARIVKGIRSEWTITGNGPYRAVSVGFSAFTVYWYVLYARRDCYQDTGLAISLLLGWIFVLFFTRGCRVTCRFSIMIQKMFFRDLIYFLTVYGIVLVGFSVAMNVMFESSTVSKVFYDMMSVVTDLDQKQTAKDAMHPTFAKLLLIFYAIIAVILLMNMLIAMMNTSYETIRVTRCNLWRQQQLSILLMIERRFFWFQWLCSKSERDVWRKFDPSSAAERCYLDVTMLHTPSYKCV